MPDLEALATSLRAALGNSPAVVAGAVLLLFGRRLYWLVAGVIGFVTAFSLSGNLAPELSSGATLLMALLAGAAGAVVTIFAHKALLGIVGGLGGALVAAWQAEALGFDHGWPWIAAALAGGLLGAWLASRLFDLALALLSALLGAGLLLDALDTPPAWAAVIYLGLAGLGLYFQLRRKRRFGRVRRRD